MKKEHLSEISTFYRQRFGFRDPQLKQPPRPGTRLIIVIPCHDEPALLTTLDALRLCKLPQRPPEVIVVINHGINADDALKARNRQTLEAAQTWHRQHQPFFDLRLIYANDLPAKHAGVGLARKVGMDEALYRFAQLDYAGLIVCLDADCTVAPNYLQALEALERERWPKSCCIRFEHALAAISHEQVRQGIINYELHLRYYVNALAYAGFPYAMHTVGSSMGVRADVYALSGGMNRRKAGEDFYFLHKVIPFGGFYHLADTAVYPSARVSGRVPFGTGKAQGDWLKGRAESGLSYDPKVFEDLKVFLKYSSDFYREDKKSRKKILQALPVSVQGFLEKAQFNEVLDMILQNTAGEDTFLKRFFSWFDGFKVLKFVHYTRDYYYQNIPVATSAAKLLSLMHLTDVDLQDSAELLTAYRRLDSERRHINFM